MFLYSICISCVAYKKEACRMKIIGYLLGIMAIFACFAHNIMAVEEHPPVKLGDDIYIWRDYLNKYSEAYEWDREKLREQGYLTELIKPAEPLKLEKNVNPFIGTAASGLHSFNQWMKNLGKQFSPVIQEI